MQYPDKLTVVYSDFRVAIDNNPRAFSNRLVFLPAYAVLHATRHDDGRVAFRERIEVDPTGDRTITLLVNLGDELEDDTTLAGWRIDQQVANLVRLPRDSDREVEGKAPLIRLSLALGRQPIEVAWFDHDGGLCTLVDTAARFGFPAEWRDQQSGNPTIVRQRLSARTRTIWAAIADKLLEKGEARRKAFASFDQFNSMSGGGTR